MQDGVGAWVLRGAKGQGHVLGVAMELQTDWLSGQCWSPVLTPDVLVSRCVSSQCRVLLWQEILGPAVWFEVPRLQRGVYSP